MSPPYGKRLIGGGHLSPQKDARNATRHPVSMTAKLRYAGSTGFDMDLVDLSLTGCGCEAISGTHPGTLCWITLPGLGSLQSKVIHNDGVVMGFEFESPLNSAILALYVARYGASDED